jgi:PEGA domain-containing protein
MRFTGRLLCIVLCPVLVLSCAVTAGSTFSRVIEAEATVSDNDEDQTSSGTESPAVFSIRTNPRDAAVWLDNDYLGTTPLSLDELDPGTYRLRIEKDGYYPIRRWIEVDKDTALAMEIDLEQITGHLAIEAQPVNAEVLVDGDRIPGGFAELPVGSYRVRVRLFGYTEQSLTVEIRENRVSRVQVTLEVAPFTLSRVSPSRAMFNPANPGATGFVRLGFQVSGPGGGTLGVRGPDDSLVELIDLPRFRTWDQHIIWPGERHDQPLQDGAYRLTLTLLGDDGQAATSEVTVVVDSSLIVRYRSIWHSTPGLLYAMAPAPLPAGNAQLSLQIAGIVARMDDAAVARFPIKIGTRIGVGSNIELAFSGSLLSNSAPQIDRWGVGASASWLPLRLSAHPLSFAAGLVAGGSYRTPNEEGLYTGPDTLTDFPGFFLAAPLVLSVGPVSLSAAGEFRFAPAPILYGPGTALNGWTPYAYGRIGLYADLATVTTGVSAAFRTVPLTTGFGLELPMQAGLELHWVIPGTSIALSGFAAGEFNSPTDFYIMGGGGFGILF